MSNSIKPPPSSHLPAPTATHTAPAGHALNAKAGGAKTMTKARRKPEQSLEEAPGEALSHRDMLEDAGSGARQRPSMSSNQNTAPHGLPLAASSRHNTQSGVTLQGRGSLRSSGQASGRAGVPADGALRQEAAARKQLHSNQIGAAQNAGLGRLPQLSQLFATIHQRIDSELVHRESFGAFRS